MSLEVTKHYSHSSYQMKISEDEREELIKLLTKNYFMQPEPEPWLDALEYRFETEPQFTTVLCRDDEVVIYSHPWLEREAKSFLEQFAEKIGKTLVLKEKFEFCR